jgi:hypothetical protein
LVLACLWALAGCAGSLDNPERFGDGGSNLTGFVCPSLGKPAKAEVITKKCVSGCHSASVQVSGLDLESADAGARLVDVSTTACPPRRRVDYVDGDARGAHHPGEPHLHLVDAARRRAHQRGDRLHRRVDAQPRRGR